MNQSSASTEILDGVSVTDSINVTAVGGFGTIIRTTSGGFNWFVESSGTSDALSDVYFTDSSLGFVVGAYGKVLRTTDAGVSWIKQTTGTDIYFTSIFFSSPTTGTVIGNDGVVLHTTSGGVVTGTRDIGIETMIPNQVSLFQNYPNPFNPSTTIGFDLPEPAAVTLKVYNLLGQEVASPFTTQLFGAGHQSIEFDGRNLASGVYFYRIETTSMETGRAFHEVRRMLILK